MMTDELGGDIVAFEIEADHTVVIYFTLQMQAIELREPAIRIHRDRQGWLNGADDSECHETLSHPASARFPVYSLLKETPQLGFLGYFLRGLHEVCLSLSNV